MLLRPPLLPEDLRYMGASPREIQSKPEQWRPVRVRRQFLHKF